MGSCVNSMFLKIGILLGFILKLSYSDVVHTAWKEIHVLPADSVVQKFKRPYFYTCGTLEYNPDNPKIISGMHPGSMDTIALSIEFRELGSDYIRFEKMNNELVYAYGALAYGWWSSQKKPRMRVIEIVGINDNGAGNKNCADIENGNPNQGLKKERPKVQKIGGRKYEFISADSIVARFVRPTVLTCGVLEYNPDEPKLIWKKWNKGQATIELSINPEEQGKNHRMLLKNNGKVFYLKSALAYGWWSYEDFPKLRVDYLRPVSDTTVKVENCIDKIRQDHF